MRYLIALAFCFLLVFAQAHACHPGGEDEIFFNTAPDPQPGVDVIAKVSLSDVNEARDTATANIIEVMKTSDPRVRKGGKITLKTVVTSCGSNLRYGREGIIVAKIIADKDDLVLHPYTYTHRNGCIRPPWLLTPERKEQAISRVEQKPVCGFPDLKLPADFTVLAAKNEHSARSALFQIDQSGHLAGQIDVAVNNPGKPVVLMLGGGLGSVIWNIEWSKGTKILAVFVNGGSRQVIAGLEKNVPRLIISGDNRGLCACGYDDPFEKIAESVFGKTVDMVFPVEKGRVVVGKPLQHDTKLTTSSAVTPESFHDKNAPLAGDAGLEEAVRKGILRKATKADADAWVDAVIQKFPPDVPPVAGKGIPRPSLGHSDFTENTYVVLKPFTYPAGEYQRGADFMISKGVPQPDGYSGDFTVYDFNTLHCQGFSCSKDRENACRGIGLLETPFFGNSDKQPDADVIARVSLSDVNYADEPGSVTATATIMEVLKTSDARVRQGSKFPMKLPFSSCGPGLQNGIGGGAIIAKIGADSKGRSVLCPYIRRDIDGWIGYACPDKPFKLLPEAEQQSSAACGFSDLKLPSDFAVFAADESSGRKVPYQIDQSGFAATQIDVVVNNPNKPVVLMLGTYDPTIWNIKWSKGTKILAVLVGGNYRQAVAGLEKSVPQLSSSDNNSGSCGRFYNDLYTRNPMARLVFGRPVDMVFPGEKGQVVMGEPLPPGSELITSSEVTPESFYDKDALMSGAKGLEEAVHKGLLRKATKADVDAWDAAVAQHSLQREAHPQAGLLIPWSGKPSVDKGYVVLKPFTYPAGILSHVSFLVPKGIPRPDGDPLGADIYDFNTLECQGALCGDNQSGQEK